MNIREKLEAINHLGRSPDRNVESVRQMLLDRSLVGLAKYGVTTERTDLNRLQWLRHLQEELLDASVYIQTLIASEQVEERPTKWVCSCNHTDITIPIGQECPICKP